MKSLNQFINEDKRVTLSLTDYEALMLRDFLRDSDFSNFGTEEDRSNLESVLTKLNNKVK